MVIFPSYDVPKYQIIDKVEKNANSVVFKKGYQAKEIETGYGGPVYILVKLKGESKPTFVESKYVGYFDGAKFVSFEEGSNQDLKAHIKSLENKNYNFATNFVFPKTIEGIYINKFFALEEIKDLEEKFDFETGEYKQLVYGKNGNLETKTVPFAQDYVEHISKYNGKKNAKQMKDVKSYSIAKDGQFVKLCIKGDRCAHPGKEAESGKLVNAETMFPLSCLFKDEACTQPIETLENLQQNVGKTLWAKAASGRAVELEPLTSTQATFGYNLQSKIYESVSDADIALKSADGSEAALLYIKDPAKIKDKDGQEVDLTGRFVKEADVVQPKCYDFCADQSTTKFDAYVVTVGSGSNLKSYVLNKLHVDSLKQKSSTIQIPEADGLITFNIANAKKVVESKGGMYNCDIIQSTSKKGRFAENCQILHEFKKEETRTLTEEQLAQIEALYAEFLKQYKLKNYDIGNKVLLNGEWVKFFEGHRYKLANSVPVEDVAIENDNSLKNIKTGTLLFDGNKLVGGPTFNLKGGFKDSYGKFGSTFLYSTLFTFSYGGAFVSLVSPFILPVLFGGLAVVGVVGIPLYNLIKKRIIESGKGKFKNHINSQNKQDQKEAYSQMEALLHKVNQQFKKVNKHNAKNVPLSAGEKERFLVAMQNVENEIEKLGPSKSGGVFSIKDGKGEVNKNNAYQFYVYKKMMDARAKEIAKLEKQVKKLEKSSKTNKADVALYHQKQNELGILQAEHKRDKENYVSTGNNNPQFKKYEQMKRNSQILKGFMLAKYFGEGVAANKEELSSEKPLTQQEAKLVEHTKVSLKNKDFDLKFATKLGAGKTKQKVNGKTRSVSSWKQPGFLSKFLHLGRHSAPSAVYEYEQDKPVLTSANLDDEVVLNPEQELQQEREAENIAGKAKGKSKGRESAAAAPVEEEKRSLRNLSAKNAKAVLEEVCNAMQRLDKILDVEFGNRYPEGFEEDTAERLMKIFEYNSKVIGTVLYNKPKSKLYEKLNADYYQRLLEAEKIYKEYSHYVKNVETKGV